MWVPRDSKFDGLSFFTKKTKTGEVLVVGQCDLGFRYLIGVTELAKWKRELRPEYLTNEIEEKITGTPMTLEDFLVFAHSLDNDPVILALESQALMLSDELEALERDFSNKTSSHEYLKQAAEARKKAEHYESLAKEREDSIRKETDDLQRRFQALKDLVFSTKARLAAK